jgi:predicted transcriptional regulator
LWTKESAVRVNARLDELEQQQLEYLAEVTGQSISHVVRESVARYYAQVRAKTAAPSRFLALAGKGRGGRTDVAGNVKRHLDDALDAKFGKPVA